MCIFSLAYVVDAGPTLSVRTVYSYDPRYDSLFRGRVRQDATAKLHLN